MNRQFTTKATGAPRFKARVSYFFAFLIAFTAFQSQVYANTLVLTALAATPAQVEAEAAEHSMMTICKQRSPFVSPAMTKHCQHIQRMAANGMDMSLMAGMECCDNGECSMDHCISTPTFISSYTLPSLAVTQSIIHSSRILLNIQNLPTNLYRPPIA